LATLSGAGCKLRAIFKRHRRVFNANSGTACLGTAAIELTAIGQHATFFRDRN
jgi:hypothetical protein